MIQIRNGTIYTLDFKPSAKKEKPIEQLIIYTLALSKLAGLRLYNFKCALILIIIMSSFLYMWFIRRKIKN